MKNKPRWPLHIWPHLVWLLVVVVVSGLGYWFGQNSRSGEFVNRFEGLRTQLDVTVAQYRQELMALGTERDALHSQLLVEQTTRATLETSLQNAQNELGMVNERLAFYEQLLPPGPAGSVNVRALDIEPRPGVLSYRVLLMRNGAKGAASFNGLMEFVANGVQKGKNVKMTLSPVAAGKATGPSDSPASPLQLSFDQFQRAEGLLSVPSGVTIKSVTLNVMEGAMVRATRTVNLGASE